MLGVGFSNNNKKSCSQFTFPTLNLNLSETSMHMHAWKECRIIHYNGTDLCVMECKLSADRECETRI